MQASNTLKSKRFRKLAHRLVGVGIYTLILGAALMAVTVLTSVDLHVASFTLVGVGGFVGIIACEVWYRLS
ncbi:Uncharacterised protein [Mycobacteroides abscessus]|nr:Uncharacterised protein [Mycobacteroides abscessus]CPS62327.1 Uncharacterised protein [Mycobacteroides abscessus]CPY44666.1 Uncharacterised protein [Mycobacteroides abscessus]CPY52466.1 Uncharacterised protein [Mycobacteroides abscessus]SLI81252.1 Uncharacterised protein [Mycobacteroides abscessus subsp. abscessus]